MFYKLLLKVTNYYSLNIIKSLDVNLVSNNVNESQGKFYNNFGNFTKNYSNKDTLLKFLKTVNIYPTKIKKPRHTHKAILFDKILDMVSIKQALRWHFNFKPISSLG